MAFVVQTDAGLSTANSYASYAEWTTYWTDRNNSTALSYTQAAVQGALITATAWLDSTFIWYSMIINQSQSTGWPRVSYWDHEGRVIEGVPQKIKDITMEMALEHLTNPLNQNEDNVASERYGDASATYRGSSAKTYSKIKVALRDYGTYGGIRSNTLYRA